MGIQINGTTDTISASDGGLVVSGQQLTGVTDINASGIITATNGFSVGTGASVFSPTTNELALGTNGSERVRVDSSGNIGIGTDNPQIKLDIQGGEVYYHSGTNNNLGVKLTYSNGNSTGIVDTYGNHELEIRTNNSERARFTSNGLKFPSGLGIDFSATSDGSGTMTSELLDDYEEGTWTPTIIGSITNGTASHSVQRGKYTKIGRLVQFEIYVSWSSGTGTGNLRINGLPFTVSSSPSTFPAASIGYFEQVALSAAHTPLALLASGSNYVYFYQVPSGGGTIADLPYDAAGSIIIAGTYNV